MDQEIKVCSYNYYTAKRNIDTIRYLISNCDIFACQETLLLPDNVQYMDNVSEEFYCETVASRSSNSNTYNGRPSGGLAIMWRRNLGAKVKVLVKDDNYLALAIDHWLVKFVSH